MDTEATYTVCTSNFDEFVFLYSKGLAIDLPTNWVMFFSYVNKGIELISPYEEYSSGSGPEKGIVSISFNMD